MKIVLDDNYRLPNGRAMAGIVARLFALQRREVVAYVRTGRTSPINLNGWVDYTTEKLLPYYLWHVAQGWKFNGARMADAFQTRKSIWSQVMKSDKEERDKRERLLLLALIGMLDEEIVGEAKRTLRREVELILATSARRVNVLLDYNRQAAAIGAQQLPKQEIEQGIARIFDDEARHMIIGEDESIRAYHYGMTRVLQQSQYRWMKTWHVKDEKACPVCMPLDGVTVPINGTFASWPLSGSYAGMYNLVNAPPDPHSGCRCRLEIYAEVSPAVHAPQFAGV